MKEALKLALEALYNMVEDGDRTDKQQAMLAIAAIEEALAQPEQEPVATVTSETGNPDVTMSWWHEPALPVGTKLYTTPPKREWVELTDDDIDTIFWGASKTDLLRVREIEAKLKELNT